MALDKVTHVTFSYCSLCMILQLALGHSCDFQLLLTVHDIATGLNSGKQIDAIALDFTKGFDKVHYTYQYVGVCTKISMITMLRNKRASVGIGLMIF